MDRLLSSSKDRSLSESDSAPGVGKKEVWPWPQDTRASGARKEPAAEGLGILKAGGLGSGLGGVCPTAAGGRSHPGHRKGEPGRGLLPPWPRPQPPPASRWNMATSRSVGPA